MKIGIISDTHDNLQNLERAIEAFRTRGVEMVIHLGDWCSPFTLARLGKEFRTMGILGNNDGDPMALMSVALSAGVDLSQAHTVREIDGKKFYLLHGHKDNENTLEVVDAIASSGRYDYVLYGHTHRSDVRTIGGTKIINPGECFGLLTGRATVAVLDSQSGDVSIIQI